jgi:hypothetical protein
MLNAGPFNGTLKFAVTAALLLAVSGFAWSISRSSSPGVATGPQVVAASAISPMDLMLQHGPRLPTEHWDSF